MSEIRIPPRGKAMRVTHAYLLFASLLLSGCGTITATGAAWPEAEFFGGTLYDLQAIAHVGVGRNLVYDIYMRIISATDLPLSVIGDTLLLPFNLGVWLHRRPYQIIYDENYIGYYAGNGFKARERGGQGGGGTEWKYDGSVRRQWRTVLPEPSAGVPRHEAKYSPPWWWDVEEQSKPSAPWWGKD